MAINVGDATLTFFANTENIDQAFARIPAEADVAMTAATASVDKLGASLNKLDFELDATASNVPYAGASIKEVMSQSATSAKTLGQTMVESGKAGTTLADAIKLVGPQAQLSDAAMQNMSFALRNIAVPAVAATGEELHKARGQMALLNDISKETIGIGLPRHVRSFLAELPTLTGALSAAFSATAVLFLVDAVVKAGEKLGEFISDTFIYTETMKKMDAETAKTNKTLLETAAAIKKADDQLEQFGMTAAQKTQLAMEKNLTAFTDNASAIGKNQTELAKLQEEQKGFGAQVNESTGGILNTILAWSSWSLGVDENTHKLKDNREEINKLLNADAALGQKQKELQLEMGVLSLQLRDQEDAAREKSLQKQHGFNDAKLKGAQTVGTAILQLQKAQANAEAAMDDESGAKRILIGVAYDAAVYQSEIANHQKRHAEAVRFENETYQLQLANLQNRVALEKTMGPAGIIAAKATEEQIVQLTKAHNLTLQQEQVSSNSALESLIKGHEAKVVQSYADMMARVKTAVRTSMDALVSSDAGWDKFSKEALKAATEVEQAFDTLGVSGSVAELTRALDAAQKAYSVLHNSGLVAAHDLAHANLSVLQTQLALNRAMGDVTAIRNTEREIEKLTKDLQIFEGEGKRTDSIWHKVVDGFKHKAKEGETAADQMAKMMDNAAKEMRQAWTSALAGAILGQEGFAKAMAEGTAQVLANLAAQAAIYALYYAAHGIADMFWNPPRSGADFAAAGQFAAIAGVAGAAAFGLSHAAGGARSGESGSSGGGYNANVDTSKTENRPVSAPTASANIPRLFSGAIVTQPTMAMVGDSASGGRQTEGVFPLNDPRAAQAIRRLFGGESEGGIVNNFYIRGMLSTQDLAKTARVITRGAQTGRLRVSVSQSGRVIKKG
jgi:hypothetical protein